MSKNRDKSRRPPRGPANYSVGHGKPPRHSQYKPGQSGNPKGRPKGSRNKSNEGRLAGIVFQEMEHPLPVTIDGKRQQMAAAQAAVRRTFLDAAQGVVGSQRLAADLAREAERQGEEQAAALMEAATLYQRAWTEEEATRALLRMTGPTSLPHPDDLVIDFAAGRVFAIGPMTHQQKAMAAGGPGSGSVPSRKQPYEFRGTRAELCLLRALPDERRRAPIADDNGPGGSAFERLADGLDALAGLKSMLADRKLPEEVRNRIESVLKKAGHIRDD